MHNFKYELGLKAKDMLTGFKGILNYRVNYLTGCDQYGIHPGLDKEGKLMEAQQFDENRIEILPGKKLELVEKKRKDPPGGPSLSLKAHHKVK